MKNPSDISFTKNDILKWQKQFRILRKWNINYAEEEWKEGDGYYINGECCCGDKKCDIYPCPSTYNGESVDVDNYILHEILHAAFSELKNSRGWKSKRKKEELLVQDICRLICGEK